MNKSYINALHIYIHVYLLNCKNVIKKLCKIIIYSNGFLLVHKWILNNLKRNKMANAKFKIIVVLLR